MLAFACDIGQRQPALVADRPIEGNVTPGVSVRPRFILPAVVAIVVATVVAAAFAWEVHGAAPATIDDAYITFAFSKNVALGHGPVYGHGVVVEGYSNFLWMMVMAGGLAVRPQADPADLAHWLAIPFVALLAFATYRLVRERCRPVWAAAAATLAVVNADAVTAFQIGLETLPYTALLTFAFWLYVRSFSIRGAQRWVVPAFVAVALMRIDGCVPLAFLLGFEALRRFRRRRASPGGLRAYLAWAVPGLAVYALWFLWRWHEYGLPLPSTYYAKALLPKALPLHGWEYVRDEVLASGTFLVLPFAAVLLLSRRVAASAIVLFVVGHVFYVMKVGGDWMPYGRFLLPIFPLVLVVALWGGRAAAARLARRARPLALVATSASLLFIAAVACRTEPHLLGSPLLRHKRALASEQFFHVQRLKEAASFLNLAVPPGGRLVTDYGGVMAYYTDAAPIEMWGLCNAMIATRGDLEGVNAIYGRTCPSCYPALDPEFFHVMAPLVRSLDAFRNHDEVVRGVWQTDTIGRYLDFRQGFVSGRIMDVARNQAVFFLERRRPAAVFRARTVSPTLSIDYPFEPGGRAPGV